MNTTLIGVMLTILGALSMYGGATGAPLLIAMLGANMRGRAFDTPMTRVGMVVGGALVFAAGVLLVGGYIEISAPISP